MEDSVPAASGGYEDLEFLQIQIYEKHFLFFHIVQMTFKSAEGRKCEVEL